MEKIKELVSSLSSRSINVDQDEVIRPQESNLKIYLWGCFIDKHIADISVIIADPFFSEVIM